MNTTFITALSQKRIKPTNLKQDEVFLSDSDLSEIENFLGRKIESIYHLEKNFFTVSFDKEKNLQITPIESNENETKSIVAYISLVITNQKKYLVVSSDIFLSNVADREPYLISLQEYQFQLQLAIIFNLSKLQAYEVKELKTQQEVMDSDEELTYFEGTRYSYTVYTI